jgi:hypothetical protein
MSLKKPGGWQEEIARAMRNRARDDSDDGASGEAAMGRGSGIK